MVGVFLTLILWLMIVTILYVAHIIKVKKYKETEYFIQTHIPYLNLQRDKGKIGEYFIYKYLKPLGGYKKYLFNCYLPKGDGTTTEVDVILLHESGLYVFESKNYSGWIFGNETQLQWTQTLPQGKGNSQKSHFLNPIIQNKAHLKWLQEYIGDEEKLPIYSYIVFSNQCTFKNVILMNGNHHVVNYSNILSAIQQNIAVIENKLSREKIDLLYNKLYPLTQINTTQKMAHIENIRRNYISQKISKQVNNPEEKACPKCGKGKLIVRTATKGDRVGKSFIGCSNYPKCRYIKNIKD